MTLGQATVVAFLLAALGVAMIFAAGRNHSQFDTSRIHAGVAVAEGVAITGNQK